MLSTLKILGLNLDLSPKPTAKGFHSALEEHQLVDVIDSIAEDYPTCNNHELAELMQDMLRELYPNYDVKIRYHTKYDNFTGHILEPAEIGVNTEEGTLLIPHIGITIRTLQGCASAADPTRRKWRILLMPSKVVLGEIRLRPVDQTEGDD